MAACLALQRLNGEREAGDGYVWWGMRGDLEAATSGSTVTGFGICVVAELAQKARKEIADYLAAGKDERARIRVEHIIREDYLVEAMEILELYCDLLLARFGLIQSMK